MHLLGRSSIYDYLIILLYWIKWSEGVASLGADLSLGYNTSKEIRHNTKVAAPSVMEWGPWGPWSTCSKSCGGGVAVQERICVPTEKSRWHRRRRKSSSLNNSTIGAQSWSKKSKGSCLGLSRRFHECNTSPCAGDEQDPRAEQCKKYNNRPFRGRYFNWLPYVDATSPCVLNCRPLGHQFYASLGLVADGTPCTKPPYRAICVRGQCKVIGKETVLSTSNSYHATQCGRRLISGLFTKPKLPLGYSLVATIPVGACKLNISELTPSENFLALKVSNGSFIVNGDFAISSPGQYEAAGARFLYKRTMRQPEYIYSAGPLHQPVDIMILYRHPNPAIKYEYFAESTPDEDFSNDIEMEISSSAPTTVARKSFVWKATSFDKCTRSCGGGVQISKWKCVEEGTTVEVFAAKCPEPAPAAKKRKCNVQPCAPRWRMLPWSECPPCGPAISSRRVICVKEQMRAVTSVSDKECVEPKPITERQCSVPDCDGITETGTAPVTDTKRQTKPKTELFLDSPVVTKSSNHFRNKNLSKSKEIFKYKSNLSTEKSRFKETQKPPEVFRGYEQPKSTDLSRAYDLPKAGEAPTTTELSRPFDIPKPYDISKTNDLPKSDFTDDNEISNDGFSFGVWMHTEWTECVGWCGAGVRSREVVCSNGDGGCLLSSAPVSSESCEVHTPCDNGKPQPMWFTGAWSTCSSPCSWGKRVRVVVCASSFGRRLRDSVCANIPKPATVESCRAPGTCQPDWLIGRWGKCQGPCGASLETRAVKCDNSSKIGCAGPAPPHTRPCASHSCYPQPQDPRLGLPSYTTSATLNTPRLTRNEIQPSPTTPLSFSSKEKEPGACEDVLGSCGLAVQARLCQYPYYVKFCCKSCGNGRS